MVMPTDSWVWERNRNRERNMRESDEKLRNKEMRRGLRCQKERKRNKALGGEEREGERDVALSARVHR